MARRSGGRSARLAERQAPLAEEIKPVRAGEVGGSYTPLKPDDMAAIADNAYRILAEIGFARATPHCITACVAAGAELGEDGRLRMPRELVERTIQTAQRNLTLHGISPKHDLELSGQRVHFSTAGAAVHIADPSTNSYRDPITSDLYNMARITDQCEHIHMFQRTCVLRDITDPRELDLNTLYEAVMGTSKHIGTSFTDAAHVAEGLQMLHMVAGSEQQWRARPFVSMSNCFVVPPMTFAEESLECLRVGVEGGMPILLLSAGQAGATSPALLAGAVSQAWAECLGGLVYVNAIKPGAAAIIGTWPFVSDLRTGAMSGGSPEQGILSAACVQMGNYFDLPTGTASGMTDAKLPDFQAGAERAYTAGAAAMAGANVVYEAAGMYASLMGVCPESLLMDNDVLGACLRMTKGLQVNEEALGFAVIKDVCLNNKGHYLGSSQTLQVMQSEYIYPQLGDRLSPNQWQEANKPVLLDKAIALKEKILAEHFPMHVDDATDMAIRKAFNIRISRAQIGRAE
ncbi:MAG: trimethylamine methyltransferase family protein [Gammaproteobacteria bacterium]|jgi:trimethylamine--corrinoid protein Co-methyltransferase|nr:trimethylamine methyltransferase family protein [Gammaproteobacteria bacterium]